MKKRHDKNEFDAADDDLRTAEPPAPEPDATGVEGSDAMSDVDSTVNDGVVGGVQQLLADQQDRYLRLAAEYDNYRKRTARERGEQTTRAQADLVKQLIDGLDDLSRFAHVDPATTDPVTIVKGVEMVEKKLLKALSSAGLEVVDPINQTFDPTVHEAVATEPALSPE
ncbi:MAG TPA: nucleotide exchange factor GrpE, partial [Gemmatimonadaceae bacterium]